MTLKEEFEKTIESKGVKRLFESGDKYYIQFLEQKIKAITVTPCCKSDSELLIAFAEWKEYNGKRETHEQQVKTFLKEYKIN